MSLGPGELVVIALVLVLLFGARRLSALGKGIGEGIREFKRGVSGAVEQSKSDSVAKPPNAAPSVAAPRASNPDSSESSSRSSDA